MDLNLGFDWCALFVYYLVTEADHELELVPFKNKSSCTFGLVGIWRAWAASKSKLRDRSYIPEPSDLVLYDRLLSPSELDHIGIILENHPNYLLTSEGNVDNATGIFKRQKNRQIREYIAL